MSKIYKYEITSSQRVELPIGAKILSVGSQGYGIFLWAIVDVGAKTEIRNFFVVGTGHDVPEGEKQFLGTVHMQEFGLVFHIFEDMEG